MRGIHSVSLVYNLRLKGINCGLGGLSARFNLRVYDGWFNLRGVTISLGCPVKVIGLVLEMEKVEAFVWHILL